MMKEHFRDGALVVSSCKQMLKPDERLILFANYYCFDRDLLEMQDLLRIDDPTDSFYGRVTAVRVETFGRFGNIFQQLLHATLLARQLGCQTVEFFPFEGVQTEGEWQFDGLTFICRHKPNTAQPTLVGHFFYSKCFGSALTGFDMLQALKVIDGSLRPLFKDIRIETQNSNLIVLNFRGGDVFLHRPVPAWYVQPPASFYILAVLTARERFGVSAVQIVSEDRINPALPVTEAALRDFGFHVTTHVPDLSNDIAIIMGAKHLVSPFGTFVEALAMLSVSLRSYFAFRQFESHRHLHTGRPSLLVQVLKARGVAPIRIVDPARDYIPPLSWAGTDDQVRLMQEFPLCRLRVQDLSTDPDTTDDCFMPWLASKTGSVREAYLLRQSLTGLRGTVASLREEVSVALDEAALQRTEAATAHAEAMQLQLKLDALHASTSWWVTGPLRRLVQHWRSPFFR